MFEVPAWAWLAFALFALVWLALALRSRWASRIAAPGPASEAGDAGNTPLNGGEDMALRRVALVIADISGYTGFLQFHKTSLLHAGNIVAELLNSVIDKASHPLILNKLEGDAVFLYAELGQDEMAAARDISRQIQSFFTAFRAKARELSSARASCACEACQRIRNLRLKAILHAGTVAFLKVRQFEEMVGEDVILVHRLLKNSIEADEYVLMTESFHRLSGDLLGEAGSAMQEECEGLGTVNVRVFALNA